jgi:hypothetical protein
MLQATVKVSTMHAARLHIEDAHLDREWLLRATPVIRVRKDAVT